MNRATVEVHLFDDAPDLYGSVLSVHFETRRGT